MGRGELSTKERVTRWWHLAFGALPTRAMRGNSRRRELMAQVEARTTSDYPRGLDCEGCPEPATRRDIVGVPLCQGCWDECAW